MLKEPRPMTLSYVARLGAAALVALLPLVVACKGERPAPPAAKDVIGSIERLDPRFDTLVPPGAVIERLATAGVI